MKALSLIVILALIPAGRALADTGAPPMNAQAPAPVDPEDLGAATPAVADEPEDERSVLGFGARIDLAFQGGDPAEQGFSLPSVRLTAFGHAASFFGYRLSLGQTREFSTVALPQILPVEAYFHVDSDQHGRGRLPTLRLTAGLFTPTLSPWWTPDLSALDVPDYALVHREVFIGRDLGAEVETEIFPDRLHVAVGVFNGIGPIATNSNNSRAYTGFVRGGVPVGELAVLVGAGGYLLSQSAPGNINFRKAWGGSAFLGIEWRSRGALLGVEVVGGDFEDNLRTVLARGAAALAFSPEFWSMRLFTRYESLSPAPSTGKALRRFQIGPVYHPYPPLKAFFIFQIEDSNDGRIQSGMLRVRLDV